MSDTSCEATCLELIFTQHEKAKKVPVCCTGGYHHRKSTDKIRDIYFTWKGFGPAEKLLPFVRRGF